MRPLLHHHYRRHLRAGPKRLGLTTPDEQAWCRWYGEEGYEGRGAIVEWGGWLGSLTASYCEGLLANPRLAAAGKVAHVYDLFRWEPWCEAEVKGTEHAGRLAIGGWFADYFADLHARFRHLIDVHCADLEREPWHGGPIELVLNDAVKTLPIGKGAFSRFLPDLLPGDGLLANQDYLWPTDSFLALLMFALRDAFEFEYTVPVSCMAIFRCRRTPDPSALQRLPDRLEEVDPALIGEAFAWSRRTVAASPAEMVDLGHAVTLWQGGFREEAKRLVRDGRLAGKRQSPVYDFQLDVLEQWGYGELLAAE